MEDFNLETAKRVSGNVAGLCSWAMAMAYFYGINKEVLPLKANLAVQESRLAQANANYNDAQSKLAAKMAEVAVGFQIFKSISYFNYFLISGCPSRIR
jgi:dynein heavy chain